MHPILKLIVQRVALGIMLLFAASILIFGGTMMLPGDVAQQILGQSATPENLANLRESNLVTAVVDKDTKVVYFIQVHR